MEDQIGPSLHQTLGLAWRSEVRGDQLDLTGGGCRLLRRNHVGQGQPFDSAASDVPVRDQPGSQLTTDHAGRAQDQDVHSYSLSHKRDRGGHPRLQAVAGRSRGRPRLLPSLGRCYRIRPQETATPNPAAAISLRLRVSRSQSGHRKV
jgi:hypothetical protein